MLMSILVIAGIVLLAWLWGARGLFSALLHLACVIMAGAIAFAVWEPVSLAILNTKQQWLVDVAWALGLALPFAVTLAIIRVAMDKLVPGNLQVDTVTNFVGGGVCGAIAGVFAMGILVLSLSNARLATSMGSLDYRTSEYDVSGALVRRNALLFPVDRITAAFYSRLSQTTFRPMIGEPLAKWHPELAYEGGLLRTNFDDGRSRATMPPDYFEIIGRYTIPAGPKVLMDSFGPEGARDRVSNVKYLDGSQANPAQTTVEGFAVKLQPEAKERFGSIVLGSGQVWLLVEHEQSRGLTKTILPFAMISRAKGETDQLGRWLFNRPDVFIPSVGGASETVFAFEFAVPRGYRPIALTVKGARKDVSQMSAGREFATTAARDEAVRDGSILGAATQKVDLDWSRAQRVRVEASGFDIPVQLGNSFPGRMAVQKDRKQGLQINEQNELIGGQEQFRADELTNQQGVERSLLVNRFHAGNGFGIVQINISHNNQWLSLTRQPVLSSQSQDTSRPMYLVDSLGRVYEPVGYVYHAPSRNEIWIRFTPGSPIRKISELPRGGPATVQPDDEYTLVYRVPNGVQIRGFAIGKVVGAEFSPPQEVGGR